MISGKWRIVAPKTAPAMISMINMKPLDNPDYLKQKLIADITLKLYEMDGQYHDNLEHLEIQVKPNKSVFVTQQFAKHALTLVPSSFKVQAIKTDLFKIENMLGHCLGVWPHASGVSTNFVMFIHSSYTKSEDGKPGFCSPFWFVKATDKPEEANMEYYPKMFGPTDVNNRHQIPFLRNTKALAAKQELKVYVPPRPKEAEHLVMIQQPAKRARTKTNQS